MNHEVMLERCSKTQLRALLMVAVEEPARPAIPIPSPADLKRVVRELNPSSSETAAALLAGSDDPERIRVVQLRELKDEAKRMRGQAAKGGRRHAATLLYHLAGAAAWAVHGVSISTRPQEARFELYEELADELVGDPAARIFSRASREIRSRKGDG